MTNLLCVCAMHVELGNLREKVSCAHYKILPSEKHQTYNVIVKTEIQGGGEEEG